MLRYLSIPELNFSESWKNGLEKINNLSKIDKYMTLFWFLGPFVYLIERDPADLWLTSIGIFFLARCIKRKDWSWASQLWFKSALALWVFGLFSALTGPEPLFSFTQGFVWIRFPLYAAAAQVWLAKDRDIRIVMLLSIMLGVIIMCMILIAETIIEPKTRLTWPYGDTIPGGYLAKLGLPIICTLFIINLNKINIFMSFFLFFSFIMLLLTGERTHLILLISSCVLSSLLWKTKFINFLLTFLLILGIFLTTSYLKLDTYDRLFQQTSNYISYMSSIISKNNLKKDESYNDIMNTSSYWGTWRSGIQQGLETPFLGIGPSGTRKACKTLPKNTPKWLPGKNYCGNHPHNFYIQLFAEVGIIGLIFGCVMFGSMIWTCYKARRKNFECPMAATAFAIPFGLFFPIQQFGSFYGQWGNLFIWFAIGFAISQVQSFKK